MRQNIDFSYSQSNKRTAIAFREQQNYVVKYRLSNRDREYQNIINKLGIKNQSNVSSKEHLLSTSDSPAVIKPETVSTRRTTASTNSFSSTAELGLKEQLTRNIFEVVQTPYPEFVAVTYDIIFWTPIGPTRFFEVWNGRNTLKTEARPEARQDGGCARSSPLTGTPRRLGTDGSLRTYLHVLTTLQVRRAS